VRTTHEYKVAVLADLRAGVGEGPVVSADGMTVHWVDIFAGLVHTTDIATGTTTHIQVDTLVGAVALRAEGGFVAAVREGYASISDSGEFDVRAPILADGVRMNDAKCDAAGRFWAGSTAMDFAAGKGALHVLMPDWTTKTVLTGITQPNGLGWSPDNRTFYLIDSARHTLSAFDFDLDTAELSNERVILSVPEADGFPDGLSVDAEGTLWLALWAGARLLRLAPSGEIIDSVAVPVTQPSSCAFGGPDGDLLLVTSAAQDLESDYTAPQGALLSITGTGARSRPAEVFTG
jgi:sugar lactone lactonase YvrE